MDFIDSLIRNYNKNKDKNQQTNKKIITRKTGSLCEQDDLPSRFMKASSPHFSINLDLYQK
jgi:hypothetical protein